ncbi:MAG: sensor domain-containing diguanylate cyclase [Lachnospiraceae bacterium]|nr:sensor domain-containing diguanylate cyclase [Lachnospiraceae bacterium]
MVIIAANLPRAMILTISISVLMVLLLAGFVLYMWLMQEKQARIDNEVKNITNSLGAGVVNFIVSGEGHITYASKGFYEIIGYSKEEVEEVFDNSFYLMLENKYSEFFRMIDIGPDFTMNEEMQIKTGNGLKWILVSGKAVMKKRPVATISAVIVDITENKKLMEKLALEQERYRLATELSNDVILNYSIVDDTLNISENFRKFYGGATRIPNFVKDKVWEHGFVHPDEVEKIAEIVRSIIMKNGGNVDTQTRIRNSKGDYIWCRLICMPIQNKGGENKEYIGKLINIDTEKNELLMVEQKAMTDPLTKAFNKEFTKVKIQEFIDRNPGKKGMLLLVDIDKFKSINDNYGHLMGDNIIIEVVNQVTRAFRSNDIVGRIGGDEFVVFVCDVSNPEDQIKQARKLHAVLRQPATFDGTTINKSASIGIAIYPDHATTYEGLIECADKALYRVKGNGRDAFIIYDKRDFADEE